MIVNKRIDVDVEWIAQEVVDKIADLLLDEYEIDFEEDIDLDTQANILALVGGALVDVATIMKIGG